ncbi:glucose dehydrogenase, partial [Bacillus thuringiensis]|nr:glucose dehydrogenase [Bacillus thuringiensis]
MTKVKVNLRPIVHNVNLPTVLKTTILPGESTERLFIATQLGEIFYIGDGVIKKFLDMRHLIIKLGTSEEGVSSSGYDERGLLG